MTRRQHTASGIRIPRRSLLTSGGALAAGLTMGGCGLLGGDDAARASDDAGRITLAMVPDVSPGQTRRQVLDEWKANNPGQLVVQWLPEAADGQRAQMLASAQGGGNRVDVYMLDLIWIEEFAERGYIQEVRLEDFGLSPADFLEPALDTAIYDGRYYAVPFSTNAGALFYRTDALGDGWGPPAGWDDFADLMVKVRGDGHGWYAGQLSRYEGLTVNLLELIWSYAPTSPEISVAATTRALEFLRRGQREAWLHPQVTNFKEAESYRAFTSGQLAMLRNWPYIYRSLDREQEPGTSVARDDIGTVPILGTGVLGGHHLAIADETEHLETCKELISFLVGRDNQLKMFTEGGHPPVLRSLYDHRDANTPYPDPTALRDKIEAGSRARPKTPFYPAVTEAIQTHASRFLENPDLTESASAQELVDAVNEAMDGP